MFVLYGQVSINSTTNLGLGQSLGEELLFDQNTATFSAQCDSERCCLLQISLAELVDMTEGSRLKARGGGESMKKDFSTLAA